MLNPVKLGISGGIVWGAYMFILTVLAHYTGYSTKFLELMVDMYPGYTISHWGTLVGLFYGFIDGFIGLFLLAWIYNKLND